MYLFLDLVYKCYLLHSEQFIRHHLHFYIYPCVIRYNWYKAGLIRSKYYRTVYKSHMCRTDVPHVSYRCRTYVVQVSYIYRTGVIQMSYRRRTYVVQVSYRCLQVSYRYRTCVVHMSYTERIDIFFWPNSTRWRLTITVSLLVHSILSQYRYTHSPQYAFQQT